MNLIVSMNKLSNVLFIFQGCLVQTGKYKPGDENAVENKHPNYVFPSIVEVVEHIINQ